MPIISLLESELLQARNQIQAQLLSEPELEAEVRSQQARQTVVMNLHDHVARSLDSISALTLREKLSGERDPMLQRTRELAMHAHQALRGLFSISEDGCDTWSELHVQIHEYGNSLVEQEAVGFQLHNWPDDDDGIELRASVMLICFHVLSEASPMPSNTAMQI